MLIIYKKILFRYQIIVTIIIFMLILHDSKHIGGLSIQNFMSIGNDYFLLFCRFKKEIIFI